MTPYGTALATRSVLDAPTPMAGAVRCAPRGGGGGGAPPPPGVMSNEEIAALDRAEREYVETPYDTI